GDVPCRSPGRSLRGWVGREVSIEPIFAQLPPPLLGLVLLPPGVVESNETLDRCTKDAPAVLSDRISALRGMDRDRHRLGAGSPKPRCFRYSTSAASTSFATSVRQNSAPRSTQSRHSGRPLMVNAVGRGFPRAALGLAFAIVPVSASSHPNPVQDLSPHA